MPAEEHRSASSGGTGSPCLPEQRRFPGNRNTISWVNHTRRCQRLSGSSRVHPGNFYGLPQSPQLYKQLLMVSGMDRYYQIAKCFRDEDLRADRQPEFTQVDMELSFIDVDDIIDINERLMQKVFKDIMNVDVQLPLQRMTYKEAMERFGSDKPDVRFGMELVNISDVVAGTDFVVFKSALEAGGSVRAINAKGCGSFPRKKIDSLVEFVKTYRAKGLAWIVVQRRWQSEIPDCKILHT